MVSKWVISHTNGAHLLTFTDFLGHLSTELVFHKKVRIDMGLYTGRVSIV